jgi:hypothetical protein
MSLNDRSKQALTAQTFETASRADQNAWLEQMSEKLLTGDADAVNWTYYRAGSGPVPDLLTAVRQLAEDMRNEFEMESRPSVIFAERIGDLESVVEIASAITDPAAQEAALLAGVRRALYYLRTYRDEAPVLSGEIAVHAAHHVLRKRQSKGLAR